MSHVLYLLLLGTLVAGTLILLFLLWLSFRAQSAGFRVSPMIGLKGKAVTRVATEGRVMVLGEYWWARSRALVAEGESVQVVGIEGLTLEVEPCPDQAAIPRPVSAVEPRNLENT